MDLARSGCGPLVDQNTGRATLASGQDQAIASKAGAHDVTIVERAICDELARSIGEAPVHEGSEDIPARLSTVASHKGPDPEASVSTGSPGCAAP